MSNKLISWLALVLSCGLILSHAGETNSFTSKPLDQYRSFVTILDENGSKLGCSFTIEYRGYAVTGKESKADPGYMPVKTDLSADSIPLLMEKLRDYLDGFIVVQDSKNPKIIHIIEKVLADDENYALNKRISLNYSGTLAPANAPIPGRLGFETTIGGLLATVAEKAGDIRGGSDDSTFLGIADDSITRVNIIATNEPVRSILTGCLPAANYNPVMWRAVTTKRSGEQNVLVQCVVVQFFGPKKL